MCSCPAQPPPPSQSPPAAVCTCITTATRAVPLCGASSGARFVVVVVVVVVLTRSPFRRHDLLYSLVLETALFAQPALPLLVPLLPVVRYSSLSLSGAVSLSLSRCLRLVYL